jgi:hypothetical protein
VAQGVGPEFKPQYHKKRKCYSELFSNLNENAVSAVLNELKLETSSTALYPEHKGKT